MEYSNPMIGEEPLADIPPPVEQEPHVLLVTQGSTTNTLPKQ